MSFLVVAYPVLQETVFNLIQDYRKDNDELFFSVIRPHFTFVFPVVDIEEELFISEVTEKTMGMSPLDFTLRCATINKDAFRDYYHTFLVPDEGFGKIVKLHDKIYSGLLKHNHRLDIDYIPHLGIGNSKDKFICKQMVDEWNEIDFAITGTISKLTIVSFENNTMHELKEIELNQ